MSLDDWEKKVVALEPATKTIYCYSSRLFDKIVKILEIAEENDENLFLVQK